MCILTVEILHDQKRPWLHLHFQDIPGTTEVHGRKVRLDCQEKLRCRACRQSWPQWKVISDRLNLNAARLLLGVL